MGRILVHHLWTVARNNTERSWMGSSHHSLLWSYLSLVRLCPAPFWSKIELKCAQKVDPILLTTLQLQGLTVLVGPDLDTPSTPHG